MNMKNSLIWRGLLILAVCVAWVVAMLPPMDQPFEATFRNLAVGQQAKVDDLFARATAVIAAKRVERTPDGQPVIVPSIEKALEMAALQLDDADRQAKGPGFKLHDLVKVPKKEDTASDRDVVTYVRAKAAGKLRLGLDLRGGHEFVIAFDESKIAVGQRPEQITDQIIEILRNRVDQVGVLGAEIKPFGRSSISVKIPSVEEEDVAEFRKIILATASLEFHLVNPDSQRLAAANAPAPAGFVKTELTEERDGRPFTEVIYLKKWAEAVKGTHIKTASSDLDQFGNYKVHLSFDGEGAQLFYQVTRDHVKERLAIVLDGVVKSAPVLQAPIPTGSAEISGSFTKEEANQLAVVLRCGNLPVDIHIEGENGTSATLGKETIRSGTIAALVGLAAVSLFMIVYYLFSGMVANIALVINAILVMGTLPLLNATVTLPGLAGLVLTIGMAVDANVLIYERLREELEAGKSLATAIKNGYDRAFMVIIDSHLTSLFASVILYYCGSGAVRGFAVTLTIGIIASLFTSIFVTRWVFDLGLQYNLIKKLTMLHIFRKVPHIDFMGQAKFWMSVFILTMVIAMVVIGVRGRGALGVEFTGGSVVTFTYDKYVAAGEIEKTLMAAGFPVSGVTYKESALASGKVSVVEVTLKGQGVGAENAPGAVAPGSTAAPGTPVAAPVAQKGSTLSSQLTATLAEKYPDSKFARGSSNEVGPLVGARFLRQALLACFLASLAIIIYVSFRFEFAYGLGTVLCLIHDAITVVGLFLMWNYFGRHITLDVVAAVLTLIGYSTNDKIVVFDRMRENMGLFPKEKMLKLVNLSINQTLSRTVLTSLTVLIVVVILYFFGGGAINDFALIMIIGVIMGTFSSIFVATPIMIWWESRRLKVRPEELMGTLAPANTSAISPIQ